MTLHSINARARLGLVLSATSLSVLMVAGTAAAQEACGDQICEIGFECKTYTFECPESELDCPEEGCPPCEPSERQYCDRAACESDEDCGSHMVCGTFTTFCGDLLISCPVGDEECGKTQEDCEETEYQQCAPPWELPCEAHADCGEGFTCKAYEYCDCPVAAAEPSDGETRELIAPDEPVDCSDCTLSEDKWCEENQIACMEDSDCPTDWTCVENFGVCWSEEEGGGCDEPDPAMICQRPYDQVHADGVVTLASDSVGVLEGDVATGTLGDPNGAPPSAQNTNGVVDTEEGASNDVVIGSDQVLDSPEGGGSDASSGCSVRAPSNAPLGGLSWMALGLGTLLGLRRRFIRR